MNLRGMLGQLCALVLCVASAGVASANKYSDWWGNPNQSGQALNVGQQGDTVFVAWFTYDNSGEAAWFTFVGELSAGQVVSGDINLFKGPVLGTPFDPAKVSSTVVGKGKLTFTSLFTGRFEWTLSSYSGVMDVQRISFAPVAYAGQYFAQSVGGSDCPNAVRSYAVATTSNVQYDGTTLKIDDDLNGGRKCSFEAKVGTADFLGNLIRAVGGYTCNDGDAGRWEASVSFDRTGDQVVLIRRDVMTNSARSCVARQTVAGPSLLR